MATLSLLAGKLICLTGKVPCPGQGASTAAASFIEFLKLFSMGGPLTRQYGRSKLAFYDKPFRRISPEKKTQSLARRFNTAGRFDVSPFNAPKHGSWPQSHRGLLLQGFAAPRSCRQHPSGHQNRSLKERIQWPGIEDRSIDIRSSTLGPTSFARGPPDMISNHQKR